MVLKLICDFRYFCIFGLHNDLGCTIFNNFNGFEGILTIILKILKNIHFRNHKIQLSRVVWSVSLLRPHSGRHTETAIINYYLVFQDLQFPFFSIFFKLLSNPSKSIEIVENGTSEIIMEPENTEISKITYMFLNHWLSTLRRVTPPILSSIGPNTKNPSLCK